jgi:quercetin dioxygenase-like cupin family protein
MITEQQQEQASLHVLGALTGAEQEVFDAELRDNAELCELVLSLQQTTTLFAMASTFVSPPVELKDAVLSRIGATPGAMNQPAIPPPAVTAPIPAGVRFLSADETLGWKELPVRGAWIKLLSRDRERGYAVMLGRLEPGVRYPAHTNEGPEDLYVLTGDLHIGDRTLWAGDFHHADTGTWHEENYSMEGCTLIAVLTADHPLVAYAMS